jgi:hypothetical protein
MKTTIQFLQTDLHFLRNADTMLSIQSSLNWKLDAE